MKTDKHKMQQPGSRHLPSLTHTPVFSLQGFYGTVALVANLSLSLIDSCVMWWISFTQTE